MGAANGSSDVALKRKSGNVAQNETSGFEAQTWTLIGATPARLSAMGSKRGAGAKGLTPGGVLWEQADRTLHLPASWTDLVTGDVVEITAGESAGTFWRVLEATWHDQATARRVPVLQIDRPKDW
jgi:hypothetical protein